MRICFTALLLLLMSCTGFSGLGQTAGFDARLLADPDPAQPGVPVSFRLLVTNVSQLNLVNLQVTSIVLGGGTFVSANNTNGLSTNYLSPNGVTNTVVFLVNDLTNTGVASLSYTFRPQQSGSIDQTVLVEAFNAFTLVTNFSTTVILGRAKLAATIQSVPVGSLPGDLLAYTLTVTNGGPDLAADVRIQNAVPDGLTFLGVAPSGVSYRDDATNVTLRVGPLAVGAGTAVQVRVQPQVDGDLPLLAFAEAPGYDNPDPTNALASGILSVSNPGPGVLSASVLTPQTFNPQTGLMQQEIRVRNVGTRVVPAVRVLGGGLTNGLYNAAGTNGVLPFVTVPGTLAPGGQVDLRFQYFNPTRQPGANPVLTALDVPVPGVVSPVGTGIAISGIRTGADGSIWLEFPATLGARYAVLYGETPSTLRGAVLPSIIAPGNQVQWQDYGPPLTPAKPSAVSPRFYRVLQMTWP